MIVVLLFAKKLLENGGFYVSLSVITKCPWHVGFIVWDEIFLFPRLAVNVIRFVIELIVMLRPLRLLHPNQHLLEFSG